MDRFPVLIFMFELNSHQIFHANLISVINDVPLTVVKIDKILENLTIKYLNSYSLYSNEELLAPESTPTPFGISIPSGVT